MKHTDATLQDVGHADPTRRGVTYEFQKLTGWRPVFSPPPGESAYEARPN